MRERIWVVGLRNGRSKPLQVSDELVRGGIRLRRSTFPRSVARFARPNKVVQTLNNIRPIEGTKPNTSGAERVTGGAVRANKVSEKLFD